MKKLLFHWDENITLLADVRAQERLLKQWTHTAKAFGIFDIIIIGNFIPANNDAEISIEIYGTYTEARKANNTFNYIVLSEFGSDYKSLTYPTDNVIFVLGSNYSEPAIYEGDTVVSITANIPLWDVVAAGIVLNEAQ